MNKLIKIGFAALAASAVFSSCEDKLDVTNPNNLTDAQVMELLKSDDAAKVEKILVAIGTGMEGNMCLRDGNLYGGFTNFSYDSEFTVNFFRNLQCEDIIVGDQTTGNGGWASYYVHQTNYANFMENASNYGWWYSSSKIIANANKAATYLTDEVAEAPTALPTVKTYAAQAKTIRAMGYLQLMERFRKPYLHGGKEQQGMPIYTEYRYNTPSAPKSAEETYEWIIKELQTASKYFAAGVNSATDGYTTNMNDGNKKEFYDVDRTISDYLLARAALNCGKYDVAIAACQEILKHYPNFISEDRYGVKTSRLDAIATTADGNVQKGLDDVAANDNAFLTIANNPECLFGWLAASGNTYQWSLLNPISPSGAQAVHMSENLYNQINANDYRKDVFADHEVSSFPYLTSENAISSGRLFKLAPLKWGATIAQNETVRNTKAATLADVVLLRSSEVWLMLAEAQLGAGKEGDAKTTLNKLLAARTRSGAPTLTCDNYKAGLSTKDLLQLQWRIEMWGEGGLNYYCHKRWNTPSVRTGADHWNNSGWSVDEMEWEIPYKEISTNSNWEK